MKLPTLVGVLVAAFGTGVSLAGPAATFGIPIVTTGLVLIAGSACRSGYRLATAYTGRWLIADDQREERADSGERVRRAFGQDSG